MSLEPEKSLSEPRDNGFEEYEDQILPKTKMDLEDYDDAEFGVGTEWRAFEDRLCTGCRSAYNLPEIDDEYGVPCFLCNYSKGPISEWNSRFSSCCAPGTCLHSSSSEDESNDFIEDESNEDTEDEEAFSDLIVGQNVTEEYEKS